MNLLAGVCRLRRRAAALLLALVLPPAALAQQASCPPVTPPPTPQQMQDAAQRSTERGFLWRISRDGRDSFLYGSIHVGKLDWAFLGPKTRSAWIASDTLALEIDVSDPEVQAQARRPRAGEAAPPLPAALGDRLARQIDAACVPREALASLHPVMQAVALTMLAARWEGLDAGYSQETVLAAAARDIRRPIVGLETVALQQGALLPPAGTDIAPVVDDALRRLEDGSVRRMLNRLARAWERSDLAELERYEQWCDCVRTDAEREQLHRLNDGRNPGLADRIEELHAKGQRVFAAVGSLHMTGAQALPRLMAERGFKVERVQ